MAIVSRRYIAVGPLIPTDFAKYVNAATPPTVAAAYGRTTVDINYDDSVVGLVDDLDAYMATLCLQPSATASPDQVFEYVCTGAEGATIAIGAPQGFVARVTANYVVDVTLCRAPANAIKIATIQGAVAANAFTVELSGPAELGDVLCFIVRDKT